MLAALVPCVMGEIEGRPAHELKIKNNHQSTELAR